MLATARRSCYTNSAHLAVWRASIAEKNHVTVNFDLDLRLYLDYHGQCVRPKLTDHRSIKSLVSTWLTVF